MPLCPECGEEVSARDSHCMDCGTDLLAARDKDRAAIREQSMAMRGGAGESAAPAGAAAGRIIAGESSTETRIRAFDKQEAERLAEERKSSWVIAVFALLVGAAFLAIGLLRTKAGGGFGEIAQVFKPAPLRELGLGMFMDATVVGVMALGTGLASLLIGIGQTRLAMATSRAINDVRSGVKPEIVQVSTFTRIGLVILAVFAPPLGLIVGVLFLFGRNPDLKGLGGQLAMISVGVMLLLGGNMLLKLAENMKPAPAAKPSG